MQSKCFYMCVLFTLLLSAAYAQTRYAARHDTIYNTGDSTVSNFLRIKNQIFSYNNWKILGFVLKSVDSTGDVKWQSDLIEPLDKDGYSYFIKADIPANISRSFPKIWCSMVYIDPSNPADTLMKQYGGVRAGEIKLKLMSSPKGAETFLVPNRIWMLKIRKPNGKIDYETVEKKYRVNGGMTEISAAVDQTVFQVVYKLNGKYKTVLHYTKPQAVEPEQTVFVNF